MSVLEKLIREYEAALEMRDYRECDRIRQLIRYELGQVAVEAGERAQ